MQAIELAIDLGYSAIKVCYTSPYTQEIVLDKFISAVAKLPEKPDNVDGVDSFQLVEDYYVLGAQALKLPREYLMPLHTYDDLKKITPIWLNFLMNKYKKELGVEISIVCIGLSLAYKDKAEDLLQYIEDTIMVPKEKFILLPQGTISKVVISEYGLNPMDKAKRTNYKYSSYSLWDLGSNTADISLILDSFSTSSNNIGLENYGVCQILFTIVDFVYKNFGGVQISKEEAKIILDTGIYKRRGRSYDLTAQVKQFTLDYLTSILDLPDKFPKIGDMLDNIDAVIIIGGGGVLFNKYKNELIPEIEKRGYPATGFFVTPENNAEYFNVISYLLVGQKILRDRQLN